MNLTLENYLRYKKEFSLGSLTTEGFHPKSSNLSEILESDLSSAINILKQIDNEALNILKAKASEVYQLQLKVQKTLVKKKRVFIAGCGATGRLALSIEKIFRSQNNNDQLVGFMAGGDYALIRSVESFEDNLEYGKKHLLELGFSEGDLLLGITEGGETSFVIGAVEAACEVSNTKPSFIYCNPDEELYSIGRSNKVIKNNNIEKLNITVGPMAISGSTRMQATTVQFITTAYACLYQHKSFSEFLTHFNQFIDSIISYNFNFLNHFVHAESDLYKANSIVTYKVDPEYAITVLTDTTERAPTFSLHGFESLNDRDNHSLSYLAVRGTSDSSDAWDKLLDRSPRGIDWVGLNLNISLKNILDFDISEKSILRREKIKNHATFNLKCENNSILFELGSLKHEFELMHNHSDIDNSLMKHTLLKLILNTHSSLVMGKMNRFRGNMMTYVKPSNFKLIDRAQRYIAKILMQQDIIASEAEIINEIFKHIDSDNMSIVQEVAEVFKNKRR